MSFPTADRARLIAARAARRPCAALEDEYYARLPRPAVARCPVCGHSLRFALDTAGLDGPWWDQSGRDLEPDACPHYLFTLGAVDLGDCDLSAVAPHAADAVHLGPAAPFVVPRILRREATRAVLCILPLAEARCTVYLISYFAAAPCPESERLWSWPRSVGGPASTWSFDLKPWMTSQPPRLMLFDAGTSALRHDAAARDVLDALDAPGTHRAQCIRAGRCLTTAGPTPMHDLDPFD